MLPLRRSRCFPASSCLVISPMLLLALASGVGFSQDVSIVRLPQKSDEMVRLENLATHVIYDRSGESYFIVPTGRYSVQLLRDGQIVYQEAEYIASDAPQERTVNAKGMEIVVGMPEGNPQFSPGLCPTLEAAARLTANRFGLHDRDVRQRLANADVDSQSVRCGVNAGADSFAEILAGSYGVTSLGMVGLSIEFSPLAPQRRPPNRGNSPIYNNPETQRLATTEQPGANLTPELVSDLKAGISDVAVSASGRALLVCAALNANTPLFCDSNGFAVATPAIAGLRGLYRLHVKTTPVDSLGVEEDHWTALVGGEEYRATQEKLTGEIEAIRARLFQRIEAIETLAVSVPSKSVSGQSAKVYPMPALTTLIETTQAEIDKTLHDEKLQALRRHFPEAIVRVKVPPQPGVPAAEAHRVFRELKDAVILLAKTSGDLGVDLIFRTGPVETEGAQLTFESCERCTPVVSQGGQHRFYRGKYYVRASLDGYLPYEGWMDLVDEPKTILECEMVRAHRRSEGQVSSCSLKTQ